MQCIRVSIGTAFRCVRSNSSVVTRSGPGLANKWYTQEDLHTKQFEPLFHSTWCSVGYEHDVSNVGDLYPSTSSGVPLVLARGKEGLKVFHNVCSHRGIQLVKEPQNGAPVIRCPYHSWSYKLDDGALVATPHAGGMNNHKCPAMDKSKLGLKEVRSATFMGVVFVNISGDAEPFSDYIAPLKERWAPFTKNGGLYMDGRNFFDVKANWKIAIENSVDGYHLPWIHPTLNKDWDCFDMYHLEEKDRYMLYGGKSTVPGGYTTFPHAGGPSCPSLSSPKDHYWSEYVTLYPNTSIGAHPDHGFAFILTPSATNRTLLDFRAFYWNEEAMQEQYRDARKENLLGWRDVFDEDGDVCEGAQLGRHSPSFDGGYFTPFHDASSLAFHDWVHSRVQSIS